MDISNTFKTEIFRPVVITLIPGGLAILPLVAMAYLGYPKLATYIESHQLGASFIYVFLSIAAGLIIENIGSRLEVFFDLIVGHKNPDHYENWKKYLRTHFSNEPVGIGYISSAVIRLKFELSFAAALPIFLIGLSSLNKQYCILSEATYEYIFWSGMVLTIFLIFESYSGVKLLSKTRANLLSGVNSI